MLGVSEIDGSQKKSWWEVSMMLGCPLRNPSPVFDNRDGRDGGKKVGDQVEQGAGGEPEACCNGSRMRSWREKGVEGRSF